MTGEHLQQLLAVLGAEPAERYEALRWRLVRLFTWERCGEPEALADEALDRLARRVTEGEAIERLESYLFGIARMLLREEAARAVRQRRAMSGPSGCGAAWSHSSRSSGGLCLPTMTEVRGSGWPVNWGCN